MTEKFLTNSNSGLIEAESAGWVNSLARAFPALMNKNYKLYFSGQLISLIGTWLQIVAQSWLVLKLTNSPFLIGLIAALSTLPSLFFTLFGGVVVDKYPKRKILLFTQVSAMILALVLGSLTIAGVVKVWYIGVIAFSLGVVNAIDAPARQSFVSEIVSLEQLPSAIALNSGIFNAARVIGPGIAGLLIGIIGTGGAFIVNGVSYLAVIVALLMMKVTESKKLDDISPFSAIKNGIQYAISHPIIRLLLIFTGVSSVFGWSYTTMLPLIAQNVFHVQASGLGYLYSASGLGALLAAIVVATFSKKISPEVFIIGGNGLFALSITLFTYTVNLHIALILLFFCGFGLLSQFAMMNTIIQSLVKSEYRGRVMSIYILMFMGLTPLGNFLVGSLSEHFNTGIAIRTGASIVFLFGIVVFWNRTKIKESYSLYKTNSIDQ